MEIERNSCVARLRFDSNLVAAVFEPGAVVAYGRVWRSLGNHRGGHWKGLHVPFPCALRVAEQKRHAGLNERAAGTCQARAQAEIRQKVAVGCENGEMAPFLVAVRHASRRQTPVIRRRKGASARLIRPFVRPGRVSEPRVAHLIDRSAGARASSRKLSPPSRDARRAQRSTVRLSERRPSAAASSASSLGRFAADGPGDASQAAAAKSSRRLMAPSRRGISSLAWSPRTEWNG